MGCLGKIMIFIIVVLGGGVLMGALLIVHGESTTDPVVCFNTGERCPHGVLVTETDAP